MRAVIQRVKNANVKIDNKIVGEINQGLLVLLAVHKDDKDQMITKMGDKILNLRIFSDENNKINLSVKDINGEILVVSQFTLYGNTEKGNRPSFIDSARPEMAIPMYEKFIKYIKEQGIKVACGEFGAMMEVELINNGPVTIILNI
ncbi:MAG: D-aminoacyl-tRNA deacylase [Patescibacteria group bacterium]